MELTPSVNLANSLTTIPPFAISTTPVELDQQVKFSIMVRRPQSITEYANSILLGANKTLSYADFLDQFSSYDTDIGLINEFAETTGLTVTDSHGPSATVKLTGTVEQVNSAFGITLILVELSDRTYLSYTGSITIPTELKDVIEHITGLDNPMYFEHHAVILPEDSQLPNDKYTLPRQPLTPIQVANAYQFPNASGRGVCIGIIEYGGGYTYSNLTSSFTPLGLQYPNIVDILVDGGVNDCSESANIEVMLDIYVAGAIAPKAKLAIYFGNGHGVSNPVVGPDWYDPFNVAFHDTVNKPQVLSLSWGAGVGMWWSPLTIAPMESVLAQGIVLGIPVFVSSGDTGSSWGYETKPTVLYPAASNYVIACGGTTLQLNGNTIAKETSWVGSGGGQANYYYDWGYANIFPLPPYQKGFTLKQYDYSLVTPFNGVKPTITTVPITNRAVPDVAGNADPRTGYKFYYGPYNVPAVCGGTSAVSPLWAGLIARLIEIHGGTLPLNGSSLNTILYNNPQAFNDITLGPPTTVIIDIGYGPTVGWDGVTGLGTPIGTAISALFSPNGIVFTGASGLTPPQVAVAYGIPASTGFGIKVGIISGGGGFLQSDLDSSMSAMGLPHVTVNTVLLNGATNNFNVNDRGLSQENTLDLYCVAGMVPEANITIYISLDNTSGYQRAIDDGCHVITSSRSNGELVDGTGARYLDTVLANAAAAKIPVLAATGDYGSSAVGLPVVDVMYPASSPNCIAVGGTALTIDPVNWNRLHEYYGAYVGNGGGGVSRVYSLPDWQTGLHYTPYNTTTGIGTAHPLTMRGIPDIVGPMNSYVYYFNGQPVAGNGGTSASTPIMAGMIARLIKLTRVRWSSAQWNQFFYSNYKGFTDIFYTNFASLIGESATSAPDGYAVTAGWDACTGLGTPNGAILYAQLVDFLSSTSTREGSIFPQEISTARPNNGITYPRTHNKIIR